MKSSLKSLLLGAGLACSPLSASAASLLLPTDSIIGGALVASDFQVGVVGTAAGVNNWPAGEPPQDMINGIIGGGGEKYLNFARLNTGVIITPAASASASLLINSMTLWTANDAPERDPADYQLFGTNSPISGAGPFAFSLFTLINEDSLALPPDRDLVADATGFSQTVTIGATAAYTSYLLLFPNVKGPGGNSMQISEVQFDASPAIPEPGTASLGALALLGLLRRNRK